MNQEPTQQTNQTPPGLVNNLPAPIVQPAPPLPPPRRNRRRLIISGAIFLVILAVVAIVGWRAYQKNSPTTHTSTPQAQADRYYIDTFNLTVGGELSKDQSGKYSLVEEWNGVNTIADIKTPSGPTNSLYIVETIAGDQVAKYYAELTSCPSTSSSDSFLEDDTCSKLTTKELPAGSKGNLLPLVVKITPGVETINFYVGSKLVKSVTRPAQKPVISKFTNQKQVDKYSFNWEFKQNNGQTPSAMVQYKSAEPDSWQYVVWGELAAAKSVEIDPQDLKSSTQKLDIRLIATDGFNAHVWTLPQVISLVNRSISYIEIIAPGAESYSIDQNITLELLFIDPETGEGCKANGCRNGNYTVTWSSSRQTICDSDISELGVTYFFKKDGQHTITAKVQHKTNSSLKTEKSKTLTVKPGTSFRSNNQCSS